MLQFVTFVARILDLSTKAEFSIAEICMICHLGCIQDRRKTPFSGRTEARLKLSDYSNCLFSAIFHI